MPTKSCLHPCRFARISVEDGKRVAVCHHPSYAEPMVIDDPESGDCSGFEFSTTRVVGE